MKSVEKMARILSLFSMDRTSLTISEIQKELDLPKSTIFRILNSLEKYEYIQRNPETHRYSLGFNFFRLGSIVQSQLDFRNVALPIMKKLVEETNETLELNIMDGLKRICVEKVDSPLDVRNFVRIGEPKPIHLGASGKVLLAYINEKDREEILKQLSQSEKQISFRKLRKDLEEIRNKGYSITKGERVPGSFAVAAPIFGQKNRIIASLTIAGPIQRLTEGREIDLVLKLKEGTDMISNRLGYFKTEKNG